MCVPIATARWHAAPPPMTTVLLSLGSNVRPQHHLQAAVQALRERFGQITVSPAYRTPAVGFDGPDFLNNAVMLDTGLPLVELDDWLHAVEDAQCGAGREILHRRIGRGRLGQRLQP